MSTDRLLTVAQLIVETLSLTATPADVAARLAAADSVDWPLLLHHADGHSLTPLLYSRWQQAGALDALPPDIRARLAQSYHDNQTRNRHIRAELLEIHRLLTAAGVPHVLLKGWPLAEQLYTGPAQRVLYDHDLLTPPDCAHLGHRALRQAGFSPLPTKDEWVEKHLPPLWRNDGYVWDGYLFDPDYPRPVELHLTLWENGWRGLALRPLPGLWQRLRTMSVAGAPMQLLSPEDTLIHLAMHFAGHLIERDARLNQLLDLALFAEQVQQMPTFNWPGLLALAAQAGVRRFVYASLRLANDIFAAPLPPPPIWRALAQATPPRFSTWLTGHARLDVLTADYRRSQPDAAYKLTFLAANSWQERLGIVRFALLPPLGQLQVKYGLRHRRLGVLWYPRHLLERINRYGRSLVAG